MEQNKESNFEKEKEIVAQLQEMYHPRAVILHGSRARGDAREKSDWDFILFVDAPIFKGKQTILGEAVDIDYVTPPFDAKEHFDGTGWVLNKDNVKIVHDTDAVASSFVRISQEEIEKGFGASAEQKESRKIWFESMLEKLKDTKEKVTLFPLYKAQFIERAIASYFHLIENTFKPSLTQALAHIEKNDPQLFHLIQQMTVSQGDDVIDSAQKIVRRIFT